MVSLESGKSELSDCLIILIHGGASSRRSYKNVVIRLEEDGFQCIAIDLPGHGSAVDQRPFTFKAATETVSKVVSEAEPAKKIMVVGISLGGQVVLSFLQSPAAQNVDAAIVSGVSIGPPDDQTPWEMPHMPSDKTQLVEMMKDVRIAGMENMPDLQAQSFGFTFAPAESSSAPPALVVVGEFDTAMLRRDCGPLTAKLKKLNDQSDSLVIPNAWHNHNIDIPDIFAKVISDWAHKTLRT